MENKIYVQAVAHFYMCDYELAEKIIQSAELNGTKGSLDKIVYNDEGDDMNAPDRPIHY